MIVQHLDQLPRHYRHVYLAPHLDDGALSCGGTIAHQVEAGEPALVLTFCTAAPAAAGPFSPLALAFHREWGLAPEQVVAARLREEQAALHTLGADGFWAGALDAIYRHPTAYHSRETLFAAPDPADPLLPAASAVIAALRERLPAAHFYAPLGVGSHVDHLLVRQAALRALGPAVICYEDFPYVARPGALERRMAALGEPLQPLLVDVAATLPRKIAALSSYSSQLPELANSQLGRPVPPAQAAALFAEVVQAYARQIGGERPVERFWRRG